MSDENQIEEVLTIESEPTEASAEEAQMDSILSQLDANDDDIGVLAEDMPEETAELEVSQPEPDTSSDQEEVREEPEANEESPDLEKALSALRRDGLPNALIEKMSNEEILEYGDKRSKVQGDTDDAYRQLSELKKAQETAPENIEKSEVPAEPVDQPSFVNLQEAVQPFAEIFGDDAAEALQHVTAAALQPYKEQISAQQNVLEGFLMREAKVELAGQFPSISTDRGFADVQERMQTLVKSGEYSDISTLMADAARLTFADEGGPQGKEQQTRLANRKASGQPTVNGSTGANEGPPMTDDERDEAILDALESGTSPEDAMRMFY